MEVMFSRAPKATRGSNGPPKPGDELLPLIQLVLSSLSLRFEHAHCWSFDDSQRMCYMSTTTEPLFKGPHGTDVNLEWALHVINFFRYHALRSEEATLHGPWKELTESDNGLGLPQLMKQQVNNDEPVIGQQWQGTYGESLQFFFIFIANSNLVAYLERHEIQKIREAVRGQGDYYQDKNIEAGEGAIQV